MPLKLDPSSITEEKSLWQIYLKSRAIRSSRFQVLAVGSAMSILAFNAYFLNHDPSLISASLEAWASLGFRFALITLGFLLSGFTVFATLTKPEMMLEMMAHTDPETGLPTLKKNFFVFMRVFIAYIFFLIVYLSVILFGSSSGIGENLLNQGWISDLVAFSVVKAMYVLVGTSLVYLIFLLKSYIYNIYAIVMNFLRWEYLKQND